jgi:hypothetical protein
VRVSHCIVAKLRKLYELAKKTAEKIGSVRKNVVFQTLSAEGLPIA